MGFQVMIVYELEDSAGYAPLRAELETLHWSFERNGMPLPRMCCWAELQGCDTAADAERAAEDSFVVALEAASRNSDALLSPIRLAFLAFWKSAVILRAA
jgi:hypothetical protein